MDKCIIREYNATFFRTKSAADKTISIGITVTTDLIRNFYIRMVSSPFCF